MSSKKLGFFQAMGVTFYCSLIGIFFWEGNKIFGKMNTYIGPVAFLLLFAVSVMVCALLVFYKPYKLFFAGKKKEAVDVVLFTTLGLFVFLLVSLGLMVVFK
jgi:uncharacterized membrane protein YidH (DUF202 family)